MPSSLLDASERGLARVEVLAGTRARALVAGTGLFLVTTRVAGATALRLLAAVAALFETASWRALGDEAFAVASAPADIKAGAALA